MHVCVYVGGGGGGACIGRKFGFQNWLDLVVKLETPHCLK